MTGELLVYLETKNKNKKLKDPKTNAVLSEHAHLYTLPLSIYIIIITIKPMKQPEE